VKFTKMQGIGNDYIYINCLNQTIENIPEYTKFLSNRHFGIGSDGVILICPSDVADFKMQIYNSDGSTAQMCGNGIRCVGKYVYDSGLTIKKELTIETLSGIKHLQLHTKEDKVISVTVDMGIPVFAAEKIPVNLSQNAVINYPYPFEDKVYTITCVSMGNPHTILFLDKDINDIDVCKIGSSIENANVFPERTNVEFANVIDKNNINMRVWERGAGETLACGTGACAVACAAMLTGLCERLVNVHLPGGKLHIAWDEISDHIYMTGSATKVFDGEIT
jgi:diaminopimelate epimerase